MPETATGTDDSDSDSDSDVEMVYPMAPHDYQVAYPAQGGPLSLRAQHPDVQEVIQATISRLELKIVLEDALPYARNRGRGVRQTMVETGRALVPKEKFRSLVTRLITDAHFLKTLASIVCIHLRLSRLKYILTFRQPNQRISTFRGKIKDKTNGSVISFFRLVPGDATRDDIEWLLSHLIYIYPCDVEVSLYF